jgi:hypothetical protein
MFLQSSIRDESMVKYAKKSIHYVVTITFMV